MTPFDLHEVPLEGVRLIEAGAGTGKTYNIEGLYLRLLLDAGLAVDQILVLTFTVAATEELRSRIRHRLARLRAALAGDPVNDTLVSGLAARRSLPDRSLRFVEEALLDFDRAAIFTIHGFCQRLLTEHAFESGSRFDTELVADPSPIIEEAAADFWRRHLYGAPPELAAYFFDQQMTGPATLAGLHASLNRAGDFTIAGRMRTPPTLTRLHGFRSRLADLRTRWAESRQPVAEALMSPALKVRPYGRLKNPDNTAESPRKTKVAALCRQMDRHLDEAGLGFPLFADFSLFTTDRIAGAVRKGAKAPAHPFFRACDALAREEAALKEQMARHLLWFKTEFTATAPSLLADCKRRRNVLFYDDLLLGTRNALRDGRGLGRAAAERYRAALVDEFQDTDPVQYEIFSRLFARRKGILFMIGDPKQAIYGFRGADVFSYLSAANDADARYSLLENWRSSPALVRAVNTLFSAAKHPFLLNGIEFAPAHPAQDSGSGNGMEIWLVPGGDDGKPASKTDAARLVYRCVADEIQRLRSAGRPAGEIAVLVRTNRQAREMKKTLSGRGVPAVLYNAGSVFASEEAAQLQRLLAGVADAGNPGTLRAAMTTDLIGVPADRLGPETLASDGWMQRAAPFASDGRTWREQGFVRMFQQLMQREGVRRRLLGFPDGERRLTNLLHLVELCHRQSVERALGPTGLLKWLSGRRVATGSADDEEQLRLESDARAVQVITVHRSKGLEFPVVFVPFGYESDALPSAAPLVFHDPEDGYRLTLDLGGGDRQRSEQAVRTESLAERLRLLYVALTRAKERCTLVWGRVNQVATAALTYLLHAERARDAVDPAASLAAAVAQMTEAEFFAPLHRLAEAGKGSLRIRPIHTVSAQRPFPTPPDDQPPRLTAKPFSGRIDRTWRVASYSQLAADRSGHTVGEGPDRDRVGPGAAPASDQPAAAPEHADILAFPGGARAGNFFHDLLENAPFSPDAAESRRQRIAEMLQHHGYSPLWQEAVSRGLERVLATPLLGAPTRELRLCEVPRSRRRHELAFFFPLKRIDSRALTALLPSVPAGRLQFSPVEGYLKGYIDLVFYHDDRYYLVDWKSNRIGPRADDYGREALARVMRDARYGLQSDLYALALDLYLRRRAPGYCFDTGFGGVFYLFIRGMRPEHGTALGVHFDRPSANRMAALKNALVAKRPDRPEDH